jgi:GntP family gluconate:H+ symporter
MSGGDLYLVAISCGGIALAIMLIVKARFHPFLGLLCAALLIGLAAGMVPAAVVASIEKGFGDILRGTGIVVALGLALGTMLQVSGGAHALAAAALRWTGQSRAAWGGLIAAFLLGLPLFFETGVVLLMPIIAAGIAIGTDKGALRLKVMLSALAGLSVLHALLPPHPGPLIAVTALGAPLGRTMLLGFLAAVPTALIAGPLLARYTTRGVEVSETGIASAPVMGDTHALRALIVLLVPVLLIASSAFVKLDPGAKVDPLHRWLEVLSDPVVAMLFATLLALVLLFGRRATDKTIQQTVWTEALTPAAGILLAIGAGGALKQVLVDAGLSAVFAKLATTGAIQPVLLAWLVAASIRVATGSATVATVTAAGVMAGVASQHLADPALLVLAIGSGSVFFSHVNDPGFWLVKAYLGTSTADTFKTWSVLETVISVVGLAFVLVMQAGLGG